MINTTMKVEFNKNEALERMGDDVELLALVIRTFVKELPVYISDIEEAIESKDSRIIEKAAHRLKGASGTIGLESARKAAFKLEKSARDGHELSDLSLQAKNLYLHVREAAPFLKMWLDSNS